MKFEIEMTVLRKTGVLDPVGEEIKKALHALGFRDIKEVKFGKYWNFGVVGSNRNEVEGIFAKAAEVEPKIYNPQLERYHITSIKRVRN